MKPKLLSRAIIPKAPVITSWTIIKPDWWPMSQCLEFLELSDDGQERIFTQLQRLPEQQGAAAVRYFVIIRLVMWIKQYQAEVLNQAPDTNTPYPQLYSPIGQMTPTALLTEFRNHKNPEFLEQRP